MQSRTFPSTKVKSHVMATISPIFPYRRRRQLRELQGLSARADARASCVRVPEGVTTLSGREGNGRRSGGRVITAKSNNLAGNWPERENYMGWRINVNNPRQPPHKRRGTENRSNGNLKMQKWWGGNARCIWTFLHTWVLRVHFCPTKSKKKKK